MKKFKVLLALLFILAGHQAAFSQIKYKGKVVSIVDGKTVVIELATRNRLTAELQYIEVPEPEQQLHQTVKDHLQNLLLGKEVEFLAKGMTLTKTVGQMFADGIDVSQQMIRDGGAWHTIVVKTERDANLSKIYETSERQARAEKRGIWAIENLRPAWEFRAQKEAVKKMPEKSEPEQTATAAAAAARPVNPRTRRWTVEERQQANAKVQMWADVGSSDPKKAAEVTTNLFAHYDPARKIGYVATAGSILNLKGNGKTQKVWCQISYLYKGEETSASDSVYAVAILSESPKDYNFLKFNDLTVFADGQKISLGRARRVWRQMPSSVQELMLYKVGRSSLEKIAGAKKLTVNLGSFSGAAGTEAQNLIKNLLSNVN